MAFPFRKKKQEEQTEMTTLEQVRKAYDDLSDDDKKKFHQSISDRIHESIGEQEHDDGNEDSQSAERHASTKRAAQNTPTARAK